MVENDCLEIDDEARNEMVRRRCLRVYLVQLSDGQAWAPEWLAAAWRASNPSRLAARRQTRLKLLDKLALDEELRRAVVSAYRLGGEEAVRSLLRGWVLEVA